MTDDLTQQPEIPAPDGGAAPKRPRRRIRRLVLLVLLGLFLLGKCPLIIEGYFQLPGIITAWLAAPLALCGLLVLLVKTIVWLASRCKEAVWDRWATASLLLVLWVTPIRDYAPTMTGYYIRVKLHADVPAILAWADSYTPPPEAIRPEHEGVVFVPDRDMPQEFRAVGRNVIFNIATREARIVNGSALVGHWGITVGHGAGDGRGESKWLRLNSDAYLWSSE